MSRNFWLLLFVALVLTSFVGTVAAIASTIDITAESDGGLRTRTEVSTATGDGNLLDNPPLASDESVAIVGYNERTMATAGNTSYHKGITIGDDYIDTDREIDHSGGAILISSESTTVLTAANETDSTQSYCPFSTGEEADTTSSSFSLAEAGSHVVLTEGLVVSSSETSGSQLNYYVNVSPSEQSGNASGSATGYVDAKIMGGNDGNLTASQDIEERTTVRGDMISLAMDVSLKV